MDSAFFSVKRAFHATLRFGRGVLKEVGLTPARFDVLQALADGRIPRTQAGLRLALGVARATICEMLQSLVRCGWIVRTRDPADRRTYRVDFTQVGKEIFERAIEVVFGDALVQRAVDDAFVDRVDDDGRVELASLTWTLRRAFGDSAIEDLYPVDEDWIEGVFHEFNEHVQAIIDAFLPELEQQAELSFGRDHDDGSGDP